MLNLKTTKIIIFSLATILVIAAVIYSKFAIKRSEIKASEQIINARFNDAHLNLIRIDTFENLLTNTYKEQIEIKRSGTLMEVSLKNYNNANKDFYNGNEALLQYTLNDHNFEIKIVDEFQNINGRFKLKDGGVFVPNDILIRLIEKNYN